MADALHRFVQTQMAVGQDRVLLVRVEQTVVRAQQAVFALARRGDCDAGLRDVRAERLDCGLESLRREHAHRHLAVLEAGAAFGGEQVYIVADAVQVRSLGPDRIDAVAAPDHGPAIAGGLAVVDQGPGLRVDALRPDFGLPLPLRVEGGTGLGPVHRAVAILEDIRIDALGALDPVRTGPRSLKLVGHDREVALRLGGGREFLLGDAAAPRCLLIDAGDRADDDVPATDAAQRRRVDAARIFHEWDEQTTGHRLVDGVGDVDPPPQVVGGVDRQAGHQFERGVDHGDAAVVRVPHPGRVRVHAGQDRISDGGCGHRRGPCTESWMRCLETFIQRCTKMW